MIEYVYQNILYFYNNINILLRWFELHIWVHHICYFFYKINCCCPSLLRTVTDTVNCTATCHSTNENKLYAIVIVVMFVRSVLSFQHETEQCRPTNAERARNMTWWTNLLKYNIRIVLSIKLCGDIFVILNLEISHFPFSFGNIILLLTLYELKTGEICRRIKIV